jgi:hypothetical protein
MTTFSGKLRSVLLAFTMIVCSFLSANAQRASFSGEWKLDASKSELGEFSSRVPLSIKASQKDDAITVTKTTPGFNGGEPMTTTVTLTYDGKVVESEGFGGAKRKSTAKWSDDGKTLTISSNMVLERDGQSFEIKSTENWTLTKDGWLSIVTNSSTPRGEMTIKAVYTK